MCKDNTWLRCVHTPTASGCDIPGGLANVRYVVPFLVQLNLLISLHHTWMSVFFCCGLTCCTACPLCKHAEVSKNEQRSKCCCQNSSWPKVCELHFLQSRARGCSSGFWGTRSAAVFPPLCVLWVIRSPEKGGESVVWSHLLTQLILFERYKFNLNNSQPRTTPRTATTVRWCGQQLIEFAEICWK